MSGELTRNEQIEQERLPDDLDTMTLKEVGRLLKQGHKPRDGWDMQHDHQPTVNENGPACKLWAAMLWNGKVFAYVEKTINDPEDEQWACQYVRTEVMRKTLRKEWAQLEGQKRNS